MNMLLAVGLASLIVGVGGCADSDLKNLTRSTNVSFAKAMKSAETAIPDGRTVEAGLEREGEEGRLIYDIAMIDSKQDLRHVYIDASTSEVVRIH